MYKAFLIADDYGLSKEINSAINHLGNSSLISGTSVLANFLDIESVKNLKDLSNKINIGFHFNLTEGYPVTKCSKVSSLVNKDNQFLGYKEFVKRYLFGRIDLNEVLLEFKNQAVRIFITV